MFLILLVLFFVIYFVSFICEDNLGFVNSMFSMIVYLIMVFWFLYKNRNTNLFCAETLIFTFAFIIIFFDDLVLKNIIEFSSIYSMWTEKIENRAMNVSMIGIMAFLIGGEVASSKNRWVWRLHPKKDFANCSLLLFFVRMLSFCITIYIFYLVISGQYLSFYKYNGRFASLYSGSTHLVYLSVLQFVVTLFEIIRLKELGVCNIREMLRKSNKLALSNLLILSLFLYFSGNRNEMLLILLPAVIMYSLLLNRLKNKMFVIGGIIGFALMIISGLTRQVVGTNNDIFRNVGLFEILRDFGPASICHKGLIQYTDSYEPVYFTNGIIALSSSVPFLGGIVKDILGVEEDNRSAVLTTQQFQSKNNADSGLGTMLIGDLYYTGKIYFVIFFMFFLGYFLSISYIRFYIIKDFNIPHLIIFVWVFANSIYLLRSEWYALFRYIGFSMCLYFILNIIAKSHASKN